MLLDTHTNLTWYPEHSKETLLGLLDVARSLAGASRE
jgi:hypothetical protein